MVQPPASNILPKHGWGFSKFGISYSNSRGLFLGANFGGVGPISEALLEKSQLPVSELSSIYAMSDLVGETQGPTEKKGEYNFAFRVVGFQIFLEVLEEEFGAIHQSVSPITMCCNSKLWLS